MINFACQKFNNIKPVSTCTKPQQASRIQPLRQDTVSFGCGANYKAFLSKFNDAKLTEDKLINTCLRTTPIGSGTEGLVFKLPIQGFDNFVLKITRNSQITGSEKLQQVKDIFPRQNMGQAIAKIGDKIQILKKVKGESLQKLSASGREKYYEQMAKIPQSSYDTYAKQVKQANQKGYILDAGNAGNIMTDGTNLNIIDLQKDRGENTLGDLLLPVLAGHQEIQKEKTLPNIKTVMTKIFHAGRKENFIAGMWDASGDHIQETASFSIKTFFSDLLKDYYS